MPKKKPSPSSPPEGRTPKLVDVKESVDGKAAHQAIRYGSDDQSAPITDETRERAKLAGGALGGVLDDAVATDGPVPSAAVDLTGNNAAKKRAAVAAYLDNLPSYREVEIEGDSLRSPQRLMARDFPGMGRRYTSLTSGFEVLPADGRGNSSAMKESLDNWDATSVRVLNPEPEDPSMPYSQPKSRVEIETHPDNYYNGERMDQIDGADWDDIGELYSRTVTVDGEERPRRWTPSGRALAGCTSESERPDEHETFYAVVHDGTAPPAELLYDYHPNPEEFEGMEWEEIRDGIEQGYASMGGVAFAKSEVVNESSDFYDDTDNRRIPSNGSAMPFSMMDPSVQQAVKETSFGYHSTQAGHIINYDEGRDEWEVQLDGPPYGKTQRWPKRGWVHPEDR